MPEPLHRAFLRIALASTAADDLNRMEALLAGSAWKPIQVSTCSEAALTVSHLRVPIVVCEVGFENRPWRDTLGLLLKARSRACVILLCSESDRALSFEVARREGVGLLFRPLVRRQVFHSLFFAYCRYMLDWPTGYLNALRTAAQGG